MNKEQVRVIAGLIAGQNAAMTAVCNLLAAKGVATKEEFADTLEASAATTDDPLRALAARQLAASVRNSASPEATQTLRDLLDRLQPGPTSPPPAGS